MLTPISLHHRTLVFFHIQKCAGISFTEIIESHFRKKEILKAHLLHANSPEVKHPIKRYRAIIGHNTYDDITAMQPVNPLYITMLRDPIARILSLYFYWRSYKWEYIEKHDLKGPRLAKSLPIEDFLESDELEAQLNVRNAQAKQFINGLRTPTNLSDTELLQVVEKRLKEFVFIGLSERFKESVELLCMVLGWKIPHEMPRINVSATNTYNDSCFEAVEKFKITDTLRKRISELNQVDTVIYRSAEKNFSAQYDSIKTDLFEYKGKSPLLFYTLRKKISNLKI